MNLTPTVGADDIAFGTPEATIIELLGAPTTDQKVSDTDGYPASRRVLNYVTRGFLVTPDHGVIAVMVGASESAIVLWDTDVSNMSPTELQGYLGTMGYSAVIKNDGQWDDCDVEALDCGMIASFCDDKLESIEIHDLSWRPMANPQTSA